MGKKLKEGSVDVCAIAISDVMVTEALHDEHRHTYTAVLWKFTVNLNNRCTTVSLKFYIYDTKGCNKAAIRVEDICIEVAEIGNAITVEQVVEQLKNTRIHVHKPKRFFDDCDDVNNGIVLTHHLGNIFFHGTIVGIPSKTNEPDLHIPVIAIDKKGDADLVPPALFYYLDSTLSK
ncbi:hypothetical protein [Bacteroides acidifaciens]|uniref:hypothetical protein n=1 Tax=Bacteroides acidifaciens TaxID=85831 RepID=UPI0026EF21FB|nr:hypothetical protein [Bacteroides acidifaciens]